MEYINEALGVSFTLPDVWSLREQFRYEAAMTGAGDDTTMFERLWPAASALVRDWKCEQVQPGKDLDATTDRQTAEIIKWVSLTVFATYQEIAMPEKN